MVGSGHTMILFIDKTNIIEKGYYPYLNKKENTVRLFWELFFPKYPFHKTYYQ